MRKRILIPGLFVLFGCFWLLFQRRSAEAVKANGQNNGAGLTTINTANNAAHIELHAPALGHQEQTGRQASAMANSGSLASNRITAEWQSPIDFYGKVVDESNRPVAEASITFNWTETPTEALAEGPGQTSNVLSDSRGLFELHGARGPNLDVKVSKEGYYTSRKDASGFAYGIVDHFSPDMTRPMIFHLRTKGAGSSLIAVKQNFKVARNGTPLTIDLATGKVATAGHGDFAVQCWTDDQGKQPGKRYDWHCLVTIPGGGVQINNEEFGFDAPADGYSPSMAITMPADRADWQSDVDLSLFYRLPNGNFGRMVFSMVAGGQHFCMVNSFLNPTGSSNLEQQ